MKQTAIEWLMDEAMKLVVQYMQGTLNEDTLDEVIYELGTKAKQLEKEQIIDAYDRGYNEYDIYRNGQNYYNETYETHI